MVDQERDEQPVQVASRLNDGLDRADETNKENT